MAGGGRGEEQEERGRGGGGDGDDDQVGIDIRVWAPLLEKYDLDDKCLMQLQLLSQQGEVGYEIANEVLNTFLVKAQLRQRRQRWWRRR